MGVEAAGASIKDGEAAVVTGSWGWLGCSSLMWPLRPLLNEKTIVSIYIFFKNRVDLERGGRQKDKITEHLYAKPCN
ncbi:hypothetical protein chiPu_0004654 [Chiloscyllium punctatum]|uniref:Uncharacterized protein n=1 Tax=Chiloscyllium punctatum TaxID=137246 RepID=A0A401S784_CHIPU|nr:hypothetical protein [Chiloscyllium punctatum]